MACTLCSRCLLPCNLSSYYHIIFFSLSITLLLLLGPAFCTSSHVNHIQKPALICRFRNLRKTMSFLAAFFVSVTHYSAGLICVSLLQPLQVVVVVDSGKINFMPKRSCCWNGSECCTKQRETTATGGGCWNRANAAVIFAVFLSCSRRGGCQTDRPNDK
jgi:hypothetical protein